MDARVAAILRAMWPDLPMPITTTRPWHWNMSWQACRKLPLTRCCRALMARASVSMTVKALLRMADSSRTGLAWAGIALVSWAFMGIGFQERKCWMDPFVISTNPHFEYHSRSLLYLQPSSNAQDRAAASATEPDEEWKQVRPYPCISPPHHPIALLARE